MKRTEQKETKKTKTDQGEEQGGKKTKGRRKISDSLRILLFLFFLFFRGRVFGIEPAEPPNRRNKNEWEDRTYRAVSLQTADWLQLPFTPGAGIEPVFRRDE